jgi:hypothetical protein
LAFSNAAFQFCDGGFSVCFAAAQSREWNPGRTAVDTRSGNHGAAVSACRFDVIFEAAACFNEWVVVIFSRTPQMPIMQQKSIPLFFLMAVFAALFALGGLPARADDEVSPEFFYDALAPYGEWIDVGDYGSCWHPTGVDPDWAPYSDGYWAYTDAGWTWVSYEDFGGIVYHYGRWMRVEGEGWCWAPDSEWAPAWVSWRSNDDYVGWAPLPPEARWQRDVGFGVWVDSTYDIGPGYYSFCRYRDFGAPVLRGVIIDREENFALIGRTANITNITYSSFGDGHIVFNGGPNFARLRGITAHPIPALRLVQNSRFDPALLRGPGAGKLIASRTVGNQLIVAAPFIAPLGDPHFLKARIKKFIESGKVTKGWAGVKDPAARQELRQQIQAQTKGLKPETAHARPVVAAELPAVPAHAKTPDAAIETRKFDPRHQPAEDADARERAVEKERAATAPGQGQKDAGRAAEIQREAIAKQRPLEPETRGSQLPPGPRVAPREEQMPREKEKERVVPHEDPHSNRDTPSTASTGKKPAPSGKDKDKDKDRDRNGN